MKIIQRESNYLKSNEFIILDDSAGCIIDPFVDKELDKILEYRRLDYLFLTHEHYDHISGVNYWKEKYPEAKVLCSEICAKNISNVHKNLSIHFDAFCKLQTWVKDQPEILPVNYYCNADITFDSYSVLYWNNHKIEMHKTPGHSEGSSMYLFDEKYLFSGDSIFKDFPVFTMLYKNGKNDFKNITLPIINSFNKEIMVYPGHFSSFLLKESYIFRR